MKKVLILTICFTFVVMGSVSAQLELKKHTFELGTEISYIKYEEPDVMEDEGMMYGLVGSYAYHDKVMLKVEGKGSWGEVDYDGELQNGTPYTIDNIEDYMLEFRGLGGLDFPVLKATMLTPYIGFGYRYLNDDPSFDPTGYERESEYFYNPIGIEVITELEGWFIGLTFEYDLFWMGIQQSHLNDADPTCSDTENNQNNGYGLRGSVKLQKKTKIVDFLIEPYIKYWNIGKSEESEVTYVGGIIAHGYEPKNNSMEIGGKIAVKF